MVRIQSILETPKRGTLANTEDLVLFAKTKSIFRERITIYLGIKTCDPSMNTINHSSFKLQLNGKVHGLKWVKVVAAVIIKA